MIELIWIAANESLFDESHYAGGQKTYQKHNMLILIRN